MEEKDGGGRVDAPGYGAYDPAAFYVAVAVADSYVFYLELCGCEHLGAARALVGRPTEVEVCAAVCDRDDTGLQGDGAELVERTAIRAERALCLQRRLDVGFL